MAPKAGKSPISSLAVPAGALAVGGIATGIDKLTGHESGTNMPDDRRIANSRGRVLVPCRKSRHVRGFETDVSSYGCSIHRPGGKGGQLGQQTRAGRRRSTFYNPKTKGFDPY
jgi:hypothetical protein